MKDIWNSLCPLTMVRWKLAIKTSKKMSKPIPFLSVEKHRLLGTLRAMEDRNPIQILIFFFFLNDLSSSFSQVIWKVKDSDIPYTLHCEQMEIHILKWYFFRLVSFSKNFKSLLSGPQSPNFLRQVVVCLCYIITSVIALKFRTSFSDLMKFNRKLL